MIKRRNYIDDYYEQDVLWGETHFRAAEIERVNCIISLIPDYVNTILDVGCGDGIIANRLTEDYKVIALDRAFSPLQYVVTNKINGSIDELPFKDKSFDLVICAEVLEHLPYEVYEKAIIELQRVCAKYIVISVPNNQNLKQTFTKCEYCGCLFSSCRHLRSFNKKNLNNLFCNFKLERYFLCGPKTHPFNRFFLCLNLLLGGWTDSPEAICPQCGKHGCEQKIISKIVRKTFYILSRVSTYKKHPWSVVLYSRTGS